MDHEIAGYYGERPVHYIAWKGNHNTVIYCTEVGGAWGRARGRVTCPDCIAKRKQRGDTIAQP